MGIWVDNLTLGKVYLFFPFARFVAPLLWVCMHRSVFFFFFFLSLYFVVCFSSFTSLFESIFFFCSPPPALHMIWYYFVMVHIALSKFHQLQKFGYPFANVIFECSHCKLGILENFNNLFFANHVKNCDTFQA